MVNTLGRKEPPILSAETKAEWHEIFNYIRLQIIDVATICTNCGSSINENFCPHCGQKKDVQKITWAFIIKEILHFFTHIEKSFIRSSLKMFYNPGVFVKSYLDGQRKDKQSPVSFLVIWAALFLLTRQTLISLFDYKQQVLNTPSFIDKEAALYYFTHVTYITIVFIPIYAATIWIVSGIYKKLNYAETIIICFYGYGIFFLILTLPPWLVD